MATTELEVRTGDPLISIKKLLIEAFTVGVIAVLVYLIDIGLPGLALEYPEYAILLTLLTAFIAGLVNWLKHRNDSVLITVDEKTNEIKDPDALKKLGLL